MPVTAEDTIALVLPQPAVDPHGTLRLAARTYRAAFEEIGFRTLTVDLDRFGPADVEALRSPRIRSVFSDGGWIHTVQVEMGGAMVPLADILQKPVLALINDSPCSHWMPQLLQRDRPGQTTVFIDADFSTLWGRWAEKMGVHQVYVPACPAFPPELPDDERPIDILAVVSLRPPELFREQMKQSFADPLFHRLFDGIVELGLCDGLRPFSGLCDEVCDSLGVSIDYHDPAQRPLPYLADYFIRNRRRQIMLDRLARHPITLIGGGAGFRVHPNTRMVPPVPHDVLLNLYRHARRVVVSPPYSGGVTERLIHPMGAGALVVSPPTALSDRLFGQDRLFATVRTDCTDLDEGLDRARDPVFRAQAIAAARREVPQRFSPAATVRRFLMLDAEPALAAPW